MIGAEWKPELVIQQQHQLTTELGEDAAKRNRLDGGQSSALAEGVVMVLLEHCPKYKLMVISRS